MSLYIEYLEEIEQRKSQELDPKPIDGAELLSEIISQIKDNNHKHRKDSLNFFIYNVLPGTTSAAIVKSKFLKEIILGESIVNEISVDFAFDLLSHMKGGPSIEVLLDIALDEDISNATRAAKVLKTQVFLYEADTSRLENAFKAGNSIAKEIIESVIEADETRRKVQVLLDNTLAESNTLSKEIGLFFKTGQVQKATLVKEKTGKLKEQSKDLNDQLNTASKNLQELLYQIIY